MLILYAPLALAACGFIAFTAVHTDEVTVALSIVLLLSFVLGAAFRRRFAATIAFTGLPVFCMETLANYGVVHAPYPTSPGPSWAALVALAPAIAGALLGAWVRNLFRSKPAAA